MDIISLWRGKNEALANGSHIPEAEADSNARCMLVRWKEYTPDGLDSTRVERTSAWCRSDWSK